MPKHLRNELIQLFMVAIFAIAMGLLEAVCVIYIREIILPAGYDLTNPIAPLENLPYELIREACTLIMLVAVAWLAGFNIKSRIFYFFILFGIWDIFYYAGLKYWLDWPATWLGWDCLFLIPEPWYGPVLAPLIISLYFIAAGIILLIRERLTLNARIPVITILLNIAAFGVWYWSFVKNSFLIHTEGYPDVSYSWLLFSAGLFLGILGIVVSDKLK